MRLEPLMNLHGELRMPPADLGATPAGRRLIVDVAGGSFDGARLRGRVLPGGGDWLLIGADGIGRLDVRITLATADGALIYVQYHGVLEVNDTVLGALTGGGETAFGQFRFFSAPRFETGDARYAWLNGIVAVGQGRVAPNHCVEYRIHEVRND